MKLLFVIGTRPEIIKTAPLYREARSRGFDCEIIYTGQHYDDGMSGTFMRQFGLPEPDYRLEVGGLPYAEQVKRLHAGIPRLIWKSNPDWVVVQGDTVTVMVASLVANSLGFMVLHHEAGLRSFDYRMSEEYHRIIADHVADRLCVPTSEAIDNLRKEGRNGTLTGNTIADSLELYGRKAMSKATIMLPERPYFLLTFHRAENLDNSGVKSLEEIVNDVSLSNPGVDIVFPIHPRTAAKLDRELVDFPVCLNAIDPVGYGDFLKLLDGASLVLTDSGGVQEEAAMLGTPCVTLRETTERPETVACGMNTVVGLDPGRAAAAAKSMRGKRPPVSLYGRDVSAKIIDSIL